MSSIPSVDNLINKSNLDKSLSIEKPQEVLTDPSFPLPIVAIADNHRSSTEEVEHKAPKIRPSKKKQSRAKQAVSFCETPASDINLRTGVSGSYFFTSLLDGPNALKLSMSSVNQNISSFVASSSTNDLCWSCDTVLPESQRFDTNPEFQKVQLPDIVTLADMKQDSVCEIEVSIESPSLEEHFVIENSMPSIDKDSFASLSVAPDVQAELSISESKDDFMTLVDTVLNEKKDIEPVVAVKKEFPEPQVNILGLRDVNSEESISPLPPQSIDHKPPQADLTSNETLQDQECPFLKLDKPKISQPEDKGIKEMDSSSISSPYSEHDEKKARAELHTSSIESSYYQPYPSKKNTRKQIQIEKNVWQCWQQPILHDWILPDAVKNLQNTFCPKLIKNSSLMNVTLHERKLSGWLLKMGYINKSWKRRYFKCNLDVDFLLRYWRSEETEQNPKGMIDLKELVNVSSYPGTALKRVSSRVLELRDIACSSEQAIHISLYTESRTWLLQTSQFAEEWMNIFNTVIRENEERLGRESDFEEKLSVNKKSLKGFLWKRGAKNKAWKYRYFVLDVPKTSPPSLKYYKDRDARQEKGIIKLQKAKYVGPCLNSKVIISQPYSFQIFETDRIWTLASNNREHFKAWVDGISSTIQGYQLDKLSDGPIMLPQAAIIKSGYLSRRTSSSRLSSKKLGNYCWKTQYVVLTDRELWFCNSMSQYHHLHRLDLLELGGHRNFTAGEGRLTIKCADTRRVIGDFFGRNMVFGIKGRKRAVFLNAPDENSLNEWISAVCGAAGGEEAAVPASNRIFN